MADTPNTQTPAPSPAPAATPAPAPSPAPQSLAQEAALDLGSQPKRPSFEEIEAAVNGTAPPANTTATPSGDGSQAAPAGSGTPPQPNAQPAQPPSVTPPAAVQKSQREIELEAALQARDQLFNQLTAPTAAQPQNQPPQDEVGAHQYQIPAEIMQGFKSEDPNENSRAITAYTSLVMRTMERGFRDQLKQFQATLLNETLPRMTQQFMEHRTSSEAIHNDFYNTHKDLNIPALYPVVLNTAMQLAKQNNIQAWGPEFRDLVASTVRQHLRMAQPQQQQQPPAILNNNARPVVNAPAQDKIYADIMSMATLNK